MNDRQRVDNWLNGLDQQKDLPGDTEATGPLSMLRLIAEEVEWLRGLVARCYNHLDGCSHGAERDLFDECEKVWNWTAENQESVK